jgi:predicted Zn-dependent protease
MRAPPVAPTSKIRIVMIDRDFNKEEQSEILKVIQEWNWALNGTMKLEVVSTSFDMRPDEIERCLRENGIMILRVMSYGDVMRYVTDGDVAGKVEKIGGNIAYLLEDKLTLDKVNVIAKHEIGHLLGSEHTLHGLMQERYQPGLCVDKNAVEQVAQFNGLELSKMNYCQTQ